MAVFSDGNRISKLESFNRLFKSMINLIESVFSKILLNLFVIMYRWSQNTALAMVWYKLYGFILHNIDQWTIHKIVWNNSVFINLQKLWHNSGMVVELLTDPESIEKSLIVYQIFTRNRFTESVVSLIVPPLAVLVLVFWSGTSCLPRVAIFVHWQNCDTKFAILLLWEKLIHVWHLIG